VPGLEPGSARWATFVLPDLPVGGYQLTGQVDADHAVPESTECNNGLGGGLVVPVERLGLPFAARQSRTQLRTTPSPRAGTRSAPLGGAGGAQAPAGPDPRFREWPVLSPGSYPAQIAVNASDAMIWFTQWSGNHVVRFDPVTETFTEYPVTPTPDSRPWGVALDAQGGVWFAERAGNKIGRLDPVGETIEEYVVPTQASEPYDVAVDGGGIVWFTERMGNKIGRLDPSTGQITEYPLNTAGAEPAGLAAQVTGSQGTLVWFAESATNRLGRLKWIGGSYLISEPVIPTPDSAPQDVTLAENGFPWLTEAQGNKLAVFVQGTFPYFYEPVVPTPGSEPYGIAIDSDGRSLWFTERTANKLSRLGNFGSGYVFREYPLPTDNSLPTSVAVDGAGCAWYTAPGADRIGRFCPATWTLHLPIVLKRFAGPGGE
jgi:virginiamycin B lyase